MASPGAADESVVQFSIPLPKSIDTRIYVHLKARAKSLTLFLTTATADELTTPPALGSFVYAIPDRFNPAQPLATPLFSAESSVEFASRLAKLLARKTQLPVYVGNSVSFANAGMGGTVEEEVEAFKNVADVVLQQIQHVTVDSRAPANGVASRGV